MADTSPDPATETGTSPGSGSDEAARRAAARLAGPDREIPVLLDWSTVLARGDDLAVALSAAWVYSTGIELAVTVRSRRRDENLYALVTGGPWQGHPRGEQLLLGVQDATGRRASTIAGRYPPGEPVPADQLVLTPRCGAGGDRSVDQAYFLSPLPPPGGITLWGALPAAGLPETTTRLDTDQLPATRERITTLWPAPAPAEPDPAPPRRVGLAPGGWFDHTHRHHGT